MLLDEPTTFLDIGHQLEVLELARRLNEENGITTARRCARHQHERQAMKLGEPGTSVTVVRTMDETDESPAQSTHNIGKHDSGGDQSERDHSFLTTGGDIP